MKWITLLPSGIQTKLCDTSKQEIEMTPFEQYEEYKTDKYEDYYGGTSYNTMKKDNGIVNDNVYTRFDPDNDIYMLKAKIRALQEYVQCLEESLANYEK
jgi:hypothetical protein